MYGARRRGQRKYQYGLSPVFRAELQKSRKIRLAQKRSIAVANSEGTNKAGQTVSSKKNLKQSNFLAARLN